MRPHHHHRTYVRLARPGSPIGSHFNNVTPLIELLSQGECFILIYADPCHATVFKGRDMQCLLQTNTQDLLQCISFQEKTWLPTLFWNASNSMKPRLTPRSSPFRPIMPLS